MVRFWINFKAILIGCIERMDFLRERESSPETLNILALEIGGKWRSFFFFLISGIIHEERSSDVCFGNIDADRIIGYVRGQAD